MRNIVLKIAGIAALIALISFMVSYVSELREEVKMAEQNRIASVEMYNTESSKVYALRLHIDDLDRIKNKQIHEMDSIRKELRVKDKQLQSLYGCKSHADIKDTIRIPLYIYPSKDSNDSIGALDGYKDTCIGDVRWYNICVDRVDSNLIALSAHFESDLTLVALEKKEPINKPRKTWLGRLFQKKVKTMSITTIEQNPYVTNDSTIFVVPIK
jgi:hypothetical protein